MQILYSKINKPLKTNEKKADYVLDSSSQGKELQHRSELTINTVQRMEKNPLQLKAIVNIIESTKKEDCEVYLQKSLDSGTFGKTFETNKESVAKCNKNGLIRDEYVRLKSMSQEGAPVVRPYGFGKIKINREQDPKDFDRRVKNNQECMLMEKIKIFPNPAGRKKDDVHDINKIITEEFQIFKNLIFLREEIMKKGFFHEDIKHNNVGLNSEGKIVAIDVGISERVEDAKNAWTEWMCENFLFGGTCWQDDFTKSFLLTLTAIEVRLGLRPQNDYLEVCPEYLRESYKSYRLTEFKPKNKDRLQKKLEEELNNYYLIRMKSSAT